ncbi:MAG: N utilization substance protein B-like protein [Parcubacteria group bacterium GW2011_GWA1_45_7]|nr:MAG: N utilization substance protein B-like protein [Parcubacteria group bacterium GW2011_GWA1_45_7]
MGSRHFSRSLAVQALYETDFHNKEWGDTLQILERNFAEVQNGSYEADLARHLVRGVVEHRVEIDEIIIKAAPEWPLEKINTLDRNIIRVGIFELIWGKKDEVPPKVALDEAIELAKEFSGESAGKFINGVLGTIYDQMPKNKLEIKEQISK